MFDTIRADVAYRFDTGCPDGRGQAIQIDARQSGEAFSQHAGDVRLAITSLHILIRRTSPKTSG